MFETVDHTGDLALRLRAASFAELVAEGIHGIASVLFEGEVSGPPTEHWTGRVSGIDREDTLVQALSEALHWMQDAGRVPLRVDVRELEGGELELVIDGARADDTRCRRCEEIKAVTYHALEIRGVDGGLETTVVLDV